VPQPKLWAPETSAPKSGRCAISEPSRRSCWSGSTPRRNTTSGAIIDLRNKCQAVVINRRSTHRPSFVIPTPAALSSARPCFFRRWRATQSSSLAWSSPSDRCCNVRLSDGLRARSGRFPWRPCSRSRRGLQCDGLAHIGRVVARKLRDLLCGGMEERPPALRDDDAGVPHRLSAFDGHQPVGDGVFPDGQARTGGAPRLHGLSVGARPRRHPGQELQGQRVCRHWPSLRRGGRSFQVAARPSGSDPPSSAGRLVGREVRPLRTGRQSTVLAPA